MTRPPITDRVPRLRQRERRRGGGDWRVWWEPEAAVRALGFAAVELSADRPTWSVRQAQALNAEVARARAAGGRTTPATARSMSALIADYRRSRRYLGLAAATRVSYASVLNTIEAKWGAHAVSEFTKPVLDAWYDTLLASRSTRSAEYILRLTSILFSHAERIGWRPDNSNPCHRLGVAAPRPRARVVGWDEQDALVAAADRLGRHAVALAILLSAYQGQRQADILLAAPVDFRALRLPDPITGADAPMLVWSLRRAKRGTEGAMPVHPDIAARVRRTIAALPAGAPRLLVDDVTGRPYVPEGADRVDPSLFLKRFAGIRDAAARRLPSCATIQFRDLRRTFGQRARQGGAGRDDVGDVLGNSAARDFALGDVYMGPQFATAARAVASVRRPGADRPAEEHEG